MDIVFSSKLTPEEKNYIMDFYKRYPERLNQIKKDDEKEKEQAVIHTFPEEKFYTFTHLTKYASYEKIKSLVEQRILIEGEHFIVKGNKKYWTKTAVEKVREVCHLTTKEKEDFENLFLSFFDDHNLSLNKISIEISKLIDKTDRAVYAFFYTLFAKKLNKDTVKLYEGALLQLKANLQESALLKPNSNSQEIK